MNSMPELYLSSTLPAIEGQGASMPHPNGVTIVVCTRNRAAKLRKTLEAIRALEIPAGADYEVIVVDNGSTDDTAEVCASMAGSFRERMQRIFLSLPGKSRAANAGYEAARGEIVALLDDDVLPRPDWLTVVCREFSADPSLGAIFGRVELFDLADLPIAIRQQTKRIEFQCLSDAFSLSTGCNFAARRTLFERVGLFDLDIGPGARFGVAEDADFFYRAFKAGQKLVYVPSLFVHHDHGRRTREAKVNVARDYVVGRGAFYAKHVLCRDRRAAQEMYWEVAKALPELFHPRDELGWRHLAWLLKGFLDYCLMRAARSLSSAPSRKS